MLRWVKLYSLAFIITYDCTKGRPVWVKLYAKREQDCDALVLFCLTVERVVVLSVNCVDCDLNVTQIRARVCIRCALLCAYMLL